MSKIFVKFLQDEKAATAIEYSFILALIVLATLGAFQYLGDTMDNMYVHVSSSVISVMPAGG